MDSALEDLRTARWAVGEDPPVVSTACFHSQQAIEKVLKAALVFDGVEFPYVHDLRRLSRLLPPGWPSIDDLGLQQLTSWAANSRYPGSWPDLTDGQARRAAAEAEAACDAFAAEFARRAGGDAQE